VSFSHSIAKDKRSPRPASLSETVRIERVGQVRMDVDHAGMAVYFLCQRLSITRADAFDAVF